MLSFWVTENSGMLCLSFWKEGGSHEGSHGENLGISGSWTLSEPRRVPLQQLQKSNWDSVFQLLLPDRLAASPPSSPVCVGLGCWERCSRPGEAEPWSSIHSPIAPAPQLSLPYSSPQYASISTPSGRILPEEEEGRSWMGAGGQQKKRESGVHTDH